MSRNPHTPHPTFGIYYGRHHLDQGTPTFLSFTDGGSCKILSEKIKAGAYTFKVRTAAMLEQAEPSLKEKKNVTKTHAPTYNRVVRKAYVTELHREQQNTRSRADLSVKLCFSSSP